MNTYEVFSGTKSFSDVMSKRGHSTFTVDMSHEFDPDLCIDVLYMDPLSLPLYADLAWFSPPCTAFSVASIGSNWTGGRRAYIPKTKKAELGIELVKKTLETIEVTKPTWWFIENPQGVLKNLPYLRPYKMHTIWYCHYGDTRAKPTNIWTNATWWNPRPVCHNRRSGHPIDCCCNDHEAAPRGAKTGTQGRRGAMERGKIPAQLFEEILYQLQAHEASI